MAQAPKSRGAGTWIVIGSLAIIAATLGVVLASGLALADAAGRPIGVPAVSITPTAPATSIPSPSPTASALPSDAPEVVTAPDPVTVTIGGDDNGGDNHGGKGSGGSGGSGSDDNSGKGSN